MWKVETDSKKWETGYHVLLDKQLRVRYDAGRKIREEKEHNREEFAQKFALGTKSLDSKLESREGIEVFPGPYLPLFRQPITKGPKLVDQFVRDSSTLKVDLMKSRTASNVEAPDMNNEDMNWTGTPRNTNTERSTTF